MNKEKQKQHLIDIMEADAKDGLYKHKTAVEWLIEQLQAPCRGIPSHIIEQAKQMEIRQTGLFMNWFIKHYSTATIDGMFGWVNAMNEEVTIKEILDDYYKK